MSICLGVPFLFVLVALVRAEDAVRYDGHHLLRALPQNDFHLERLAAMQKDPQLDFWTAPRSPGKPVDIFVSLEKVPSVLKSLNEIGLEAEVIFSDAQQLLGNNQLADNASRFDWKDYHKIDTINSWLKEQAEKFSHIATVITAGKSFEGRELTGLRIAHKPNQPIVFIEAGIHAREWIAPATATWFIQQALSTTDDLLKSYEWHVFPSVNPDGYAYTQKDRFWRRTRSKRPSCIGVDANRNWPFKWEESYCSDIFSGPAASSESETKGLMKYLKSVVDRTRVYISLHSYSQLLMYPWGYTTALPPNNKRLHEVARKAAEKLSVRFGTKYEVGPIATTIYKAFGNTIDYAYSLNITYPFVFELPDKGNCGFLLPPELIIPTASEAFDAIEEILREARK